MSLVSYPKYKDSKVSWIGRIPEHWPEKRAKYYFKEIDERSQAGDEEMLSVSHITGVTPRSQKKVTMFKSESNIGQKCCKPGDLVINTMWAWMAALGISNHSGIVSPSYGVYRPRNNEDFDPMYLDYLLRFEGYRSEYICRSTGIRSSRLRLYPDKFLSMPVVCPPRDEQRAIAMFLRAQDVNFRKFIHNKRNLIGLLKEQKKNIINHVVTRGINANVKFKPTALKWLGDIPEHWEMPQFRYLGSGFNNGTAAEQLMEGETEYLVSRIETISGGAINYRKVGYLAEKDFNERYALKKNDFLISHINSYEKVGNAARYDGDRLLLHGMNLIKVTPNSRVIPGYLEYLLHSNVFILQMQMACKPAINQVSVTTTSIKAIVMPLPPLNEQHVLLEEIKNNTEIIDQAIFRAEREIELMREHRARLISDVITGHLDVRTVSVQDIVQEELQAFDEGIDETDEAIIDEEIIDEAD